MGAVMSRLIIIARPSLIPGFHLAGVEAYAAENAATAQGIIGRWLDAGEQLLLAIDEGYVTHFDPLFKRRLDDSPLLYLPLPTGEPLPPELSSRTRIADLIRQAVGFHITFKGEGNGD